MNHDTMMFLTFLNAGMCFLSCLAVYAMNKLMNAAKELIEELDRAGESIKASLQR